MGVLRRLFVSVLALFGLSTAMGAQSEDPNRFFDIRLSQEKAAVQALERLRLEKGVTAESLVDESLALGAALADLSARFPSLSVVQSAETGAPEIIGMRGLARLTGPSEALTEEVARGFVEANAQVYGLSPAQAAALELDADYTNPAGNISWVRLKQRINGLPVFRGDLTIAMTAEREIFRTMGQLAAALPASVAHPKPTLSAAEAIAAAAVVMNLELDPSELVPVEQAADGSSAVFEGGPFAGDTRVELVYFPLGQGAVELAWSMTLWGDVDAYYTLVSARDGLHLFNKNITEEQTQEAKFEVYRNPNAVIDVADSPAPITPGPVDPALGTQGALINRDTVVLIGNEGPLSFNDLGWITDGVNAGNGWTDGNNVEAGLDLVAPDGVDAPLSGVSRTFGTAWNPPPGNPAPGDAPAAAAARDGAVIQMFYVTNRYHDALYQLGFTEAALNFQDNNFGRGGAGGDRITAQGQDSAGTNNANFSTPADGGRGRMQMFVFTDPNPDRDGTADAEIIVHELTHGLSNRLHGNASGLGNNMARGMGEGWSDFYASSLLAEPSDPIGGIHTIGSYVLVDSFGLGTTNSYYGIRRFPLAIMSSTGGALNRPHNPLTFADLNVGCDTSDGAFPAATGPHLSVTCDQVHRAGEIWSSALWEVRGLMINRLGFAAGSQRALQVVTDGMKLSPVTPTFLEGRDAILAAAAVFGSADVADVWEGFRIRGMGFSAQVLATSPASVVEAFDPPNAVVTSPITSQSVICSDPNREPIPGETVSVSVPVTNTTGSTVSNVVVDLNGTTRGLYGNILDSQTVTREILFTIPGGTVCGTELMLNLQLMSDAGSGQLNVLPLQIGESPTTTATFENTTAIDVPLGQPGTTSGPAFPYPSTVNVSGVVDPVVGHTLTLNQLNHTWVGDVDVLLQGPGGQTMVVMSDSFSASNRTNTVIATLELRDDAAATMPASGVPPAAGTFQPTNNGGTTDIFDAPAPAGPYAHPAPGGSATFASVFGGIGANGSWNLWIDDDAGGDPGTIDGGWALGITTSQPPQCLSCSMAFCQPVLDVSDQSVDTTLDVTACIGLTSSNFEVLGPSGVLIFRAGESIELRDGFVVETGGELTTIIDPSLIP